MKGGIFANCKAHDTINNGERRANHSTHIHENTMYVIGGEAGIGGDSNRILKLPLSKLSASLNLFFLDAPYRWESVNIPNDPNNPSNKFLCPIK